MYSWVKGPNTKTSELSCLWYMCITWLTPLPVDRELFGAYPLFQRTVRWMMLPERCSYRTMNLELPLQEKRLALTSHRRSRQARPQDAYSNKLRSCAESALWKIYRASFSSNTGLLNTHCSTLTLTSTCFETSFDADCFGNNSLSRAEEDLCITHCLIANLIHIYLRIHIFVVKVETPALNILNILTIQYCEWIDLP